MTTGFGWLSWIGIATMFVILSMVCIRIVRRGFKVVDLFPLVLLLMSVGFMAMPYIMTSGRVLSVWPAFCMLPMIFLSMNIERRESIEGDYL
jgi:hypothetical protein